MEHSVRLGTVGRSRTASVEIDLVPVALLHRVGVGKVRLTMTFFSPPVLDHVAPATGQSLPGLVTGQLTTSPGTGH
ncbi:hypothetical protein DPMN_059893 [Dreissena polymorpha]|uniref:Uncharacterized protein n=1 Tax=Dreissena polymorpha TaxID=45954 RepID=A0A9D4C4L6_DREPO|nr:hypothetical protein DPMN_059893 [Dreissena polymorpha]